MDKLEEIFRMQDALNKRIGVNLPPPTDEEKANLGVSVDAVKELLEACKALDSSLA